MVTQRETETVGERTDQFGHRRTPRVERRPGVCDDEGRPVLVPPPPVDTEDK